MEGLRDYYESDSSEEVQSPVTDHKKASASEPPPDQEIKDDVVPAERKVIEKPRKEGREECRRSNYERGTYKERSYQGSGRHQRRSRSRSPEHRRKPHQYRPHQKRRSRSPEIHRHSRSRSPDHHRRGSRSPERHKWQRSRSPVSYRKPASAGARTHRTHASPPRGSQHGKSTSKYSHRSGTVGGVREDIQDPRQRNTGVPSASVPTVVYEDGVKLTPEQKLERALAAAQAIAPKLPNYMNPGAMNPVRFQTLQEKKKLLWSKKKEGGQSKNQWESASFSGESGGEAQAKFRRLMGISAAPPQGTSAEADNEELRQKHARTMSDLEHQYELSRYTTHIARGAGFGYGSGTLLSEPPKPSGPPP